MMDLNVEEEILISLRELGSSDDEEFVENRHSITRHHTSCQPVETHLCPLNRDTLLEADGVTAGMNPNGVSTLLKRVRLDRQSEEVTFACADSIRTTGSVKFQVFDEDVLVLSGTLERKEKNNDPIWSMHCELNANGFFKGNHNPYVSSESSSIEVFAAGCFSGSPIVLRSSLHLGRKRKQMRKGMLKPIPECEATESLTSQLKHHTDYKTEEENHCSPYQGLGGEEEDGDLSWFNAEVRIGIGIGLGICLGVGLLVRAYQGTARNFTKCLL